MTDLYEKSLKTLELHTVLERLAACAVSAAAKEACLALRPETDPDAVRERLAETSAACAMILKKGAPGFHGVQDVSLSLLRAERGGSMSMKELLQVGALLRCTRTVKNHVDLDAEPGCLDPLFFTLTPNKGLEDRISISILSEDEMADAASSELADIRRKMRIQSAKVRESLQKVVSSPTYSKYLRDPIVTMRDGRFVVPVRSEFKNEVPGLVHDVSASGGTFFVEPLQAVNANNALRELAGKEQQEIERVLAELSAQCAKFRASLEADYAVLVQLDVIFAKGELAFRQKALAPEIRSDGRLLLKKARHPLIDPKAVVPTDVWLGDEFDTLVITGPNTGGKTVTLKTVGLLTLMAECGLHIPAADGSVISTFDAIYADIGDEQSIEQSLSTFSSHMRNIVEIIETCDSRSLVLFDELGAGTDPAEGAALAISVIEFCRKLGAKVAATTHYAELKLYAMRERGVSNASCEFDVETLRPTYKLLIGVPGKSNAFAISKRLGLPEDVIAAARNLMNQNDLDFEDMLNQLEQQRRAMEDARLEVERLKLETQQKHRESEAYHAQIRQEKERAAELARREARKIIDDARRTADEVQAELKQLRKQLRDSADVQSANELQSQLRRRLNDAGDALAEKQAPIRHQANSRPIQAGDTVLLLKLGAKATVLEVEKDGSLRLQAGSMQLSAGVDEVNLLEQPKPDKKRQPSAAAREFRSRQAELELDIRGMTIDEAAGIVDIFLDNAILANLQTARIIHGKGTGALRKGVHAQLKKRRDIVGFRLGVYGEGEDGVTIVQITE